MSNKDKFVLRDGNLRTAANGRPGPKNFGWNNLGKCMCLQAESFTEFWLNPTKAPGGTVGILYGILFGVPKDGWRAMKIHEVMEVSPVHQQYYQITTKQKEDLEGKIKQGLAGIGQSVADLELVEHDIRKYVDYENDIKKAEGSDKEERKKSQMRLKAVFVDEVDHHTGGSRDGGPGRLSMAFMRNNNIMPTIVDDFMELNSDEDLEKEPRLKNLPTVEKRMLKAKYKAYEDWLKLFRSTIKTRMERMEQLKRSRDKTLDEYREWLKPYIVRHKFIEEMYQSKGNRLGRTTHPLRSQQNAVSFGDAVFWIWKPLYRAEDRVGEAQWTLKDERVQKIDPWSEQQLLYNFKHGLIADYPWITKKWIEEMLKKDDIKKRITRQEPYYNFFHLTYEKTLIRMPSGTEMEDGEFICSNYVFSINVMTAKVLEQFAMQQETENYVDDVLGTPIERRGFSEHTPVVGYAKKWGRYSLDEHFLKMLRDHHADYLEWHPALKKVKWDMLIDTGEAHGHGHGEHGGHGDHVPEKGDPKRLSKKEFYAAFGENKKDAEKKFYFVEQPQENEELSKWMERLGFVEPVKLHFFRPTGPYENTFKERVTKFYFKWADAKWSVILGMIEKRMNIAGTTTAGGH